jgi:ketosteroid isomerase-like protein
MPAPSGTPTAREVFERGQQLLLQPELDPEALSGQYAPDGVFEAPFAPPGFPRRIEGREAIRAMYGAAGRSGSRPSFEIRSVVVHQTLDPETIVTEFEVHARHPETGQGYQFANLQVITVRGGEIVTLRDYWNPLDRPELARLAGTLSAAAEPEEQPQKVGPAAHDDAGEGHLEAG